GEELVVGGEEGGRAVEHHDASCFEVAEGFEARLDAVERLQHVEPADRDVSHRQLRERIAGSEQSSVDACGAPGRDELDVRRLRVADDADASHMAAYADSASMRATSSVDSTPIGRVSSGS